MRTVRENWIVTGLEHFPHKAAYYWGHKLVQSGRKCPKTVTIQFPRTDAFAQKQMREKEQKVIYHWHGIQKIPEMRSNAE